jgi:hypothetical protein
MLFFSMPDPCQDVPEPNRNDLKYSAAIFKKDSIPRTVPMTGSFLLCRNHAGMPGGPPFKGRIIRCFLKTQRKFPFHKKIFVYRDPSATEKYRKPACKTYRVYFPFPCWATTLNRISSCRSLRAVRSEQLVNLRYSGVEIDS